MPLLEPNLDDRKFAEILEEASWLIPRYAPKWTDRNLHDPGITLIELLAWITEMQIYYLNRIPEKNYLKFLDLLGVERAFPTPARVDLTFSSNKIVTIPKATKFMTKVGQADITFEIDEEIEILPIEIKKIISYSNYKYTDVTDHNTSVGKSYYALGENLRAGDALYIGFDSKEGDIKDLKEKKVRLNIYLCENDLIPKGEHGKEQPDIYPSVEINWEYAKTATTKDGWDSLSVKMIRKIDKTDEKEEAWQEWESKNKKWGSPTSEEPKAGDETLGFLQSGTVSFPIPNNAVKSQPPNLLDQEQLFWIRAELVKAGHETPPRIDSIQLNTMSATEGITVEDETLRRSAGEGTMADEEVVAGSSGLPNQIFRTRNKPILSKSQKVFLSEDWYEVKDFSNSEPNSNHYTIDTHMGTVRVCFGNGKKGRIPPNATEIKVSYQCDSGRNVKDEFLGRSSGKKDQKFETQYRDIVDGSSTVRCILEEWEEVDDFDASGPDDNHYVLNKTKGEILFGNGIHGRIPPKEIKITDDKTVEYRMRIRYRYGGGKRGNIGPKAIWRLEDSGVSLEGPEKEKIENIHAASGGKDQETLKERKLRARKEPKVRYRAITSEDFEHVAKMTPGIRVARAGVQIQPEKNKVRVAVVPGSLSDRPMPSEGFKRTVCEHLDRHRLITTQIEILEPHYVRVSVSASVKTKSQSSPEEVRKRVEEAVNTFLHPLKGGPEGDGWPFGRDVYKSEVYEVIEKVDGVDAVGDLSISKDGEIKELALVYAGSHRIETVSPQIVCKEESVDG